MDKLRLTFEKGEATRYIGHLDVLRTFIRALRRGGIPVKYSEGFNPHAVMSFALPLGVGVTSECEIVDIAVNEALPIDTVINNINQNMQNGGLRIISGEYTDKPVREIEKAEYIIDIKNDGRLNIEDVKSALSQKEILIEKKSKKKLKEINIMEHIFENEIVGFTENGVKIRVVISAGNTFNVKPQLVVSALTSAAQSLNPITAFSHRKRFMFK